MQNLRFTLFYVLALIANIALAAYVASAAGWIKWNTRVTGVEWFTTFYALGALVIVISGAAALKRLVSRDEEPKPRVYLALVNSIVPALLMLAWIFVAK